MKSLNQQLNQFCQNKRSISLVLCLALLMPTAALAKFNPTPTTPSGPIPPMGTRGCSTQTALDFTALAPISTVGALTLDQPTLAWFVPDRDPYPVSLRLYQQTNGTQSTPKWKLLREFSLKSVEGVMTFQLPAELLEEGQVYAWQAVLICVPGSPSSNLVTEAQFKVVPTPTELKSGKPIAPKTGFAEAEISRRVQLYASAGLWYAAFAEALPSKTAQSRLLTDLIEYEQTQPAPDAQWAERGRRHSKLLTRIVEVLSQP